ncbi:MAG: fumarate hydratase [Candidatus Omnitrophica bacterium]|nr:fumarate hydratase [Candidatus Omnitrophota bacterium]
MRKISSDKIRNAVAELAVRANVSLRKDILEALKKAQRSETKPLAKKTLALLIENAKIAESEFIPICQDTGMAVVSCEIGQDVHVKGDLTKAINEGIKQGYKKGHLRKSVVSDPLIRKNTKTNTPCVIHFKIVSGGALKLTVLPKGFGSENKSRLIMLKPTDTDKEIIGFVISVVKAAGADACPPFILGIGIGGTLDKAAHLAKEATLRPIHKPNPKSHLGRIEKQILSAANKTGIGPAGLGGKTTCLGVNILSFPTHIAGLPVCVNISCHAMRSASAVI